MAINVNKTNGLSDRIDSGYTLSVTDGGALLVINDDREVMAAYAPGKWLDAVAEGDTTTDSTQYDVHVG